MSVTHVLVARRAKKIFYIEGTLDIKNEKITWNAS